MSTATHDCNTAPSFYSWSSTYVVCPQSTTVPDQNKSSRKPSEFKIAGAGVHTYNGDRTGRTAGLRDGGQAWPGLLLLLIQWNGLCLHLSCPKASFFFLVSWATQLACISYATTPQDARPLPNHPLSLSLASPSCTNIRQSVGWSKIATRSSGTARGNTDDAASSFLPYHLLACSCSCSMCCDGEREREHLLLWHAPYSLLSSPMVSRAPSPSSTWTKTELASLVPSDWVTA